MTDRTVTAADDERSYEIDVVLGTAKSEETLDEDVFRQEPKELAKLNNLTPAFKRKASRMLSKASTNRAGDVSSKKIEIEDVSGYNLFQVVLPPYNLDYLAKLYEISPVHFAAVNAKTANIVGLGYDLTESPKTLLKESAMEDEKKLARFRRNLAAAKEDMLAWLEELARDDTFEEILRKVWVDYETTGNGYLEIGRKANGEIGYLGHIPSTSMRIRKERDGFVQIISNKAVFFRNFGDKTTADPISGDRRPNEVIHFKKYTPTNGYYGIPDIIAAKNNLAGEEFAARYNLDYFENKAVPRYIIVVKGASLSLTAQRRLLEFFQTGVKGKNHRTLYVPLPAEDKDHKVEFKMEPVEAGVQDSSFNNYHKANVSSMLMAHRTPISKVGLAEGVSLAASKDADKTFKEQVCRPEQRIAEKKIGQIFKERTDVFVFKLIELSLTDEDTQSKIDERYLRMKTYTPNEVRARKGMPGMKDGDKPVEMKPEQAAEQRTQGTGNRTRDQQRSSGASDTGTNARNPQGEGRQAS